MPKRLTDEQVERFERDGILFPVRALSREQAYHYRQCLEQYEGGVGHPIQSNMRHNVHLLFTWADELVRHPAILDAVEDLLGPNLYCWITNFFIKEAKDPAYVSWHQDSTYWGLEPNQVVTAWVALTDAPVESGAMKMLPGSHKWDQLPHRDTFHQHNLLSRGQEVELDISDDDGVLVPLEVGEISLHHIRTVHGSEPNRSGNRRIGFAIRYLPTHVRQVKIDRDGAVLVRGVDEFGHFALDPAPRADLDDAAIAAHRHSVDRMLNALMDGTDATEFRA